MYVKLEVDGIVSTNGTLCCGGIILDVNGKWERGFCCKLLSILLAIAEILSIYHGLNLCWNFGLRNIQIFSYCIEAINITRRGCNDNYPFKHIIADTRMLLCKG